MTESEFIALYEQTSPKLLRFFARATLEPQAAADLTAETLATAYAQRDRFDPLRGAAEAWVIGIGRHILQRYLRDRRIDRRARDRLGLRVPDLSAADAERIEALIDFAQVGRRVRTALSALTADQREAVNLRVVAGLSYPEVAMRVGCSEDAARARVSRGLRELGLQLALADTERGGT